MPAWFNNLPNSAKAAFYTALFAFLGTLGVLVTNFLGTLDGWVNTGVAPDFTAQGKAIVSAVLAFAGAIVNYGVRWVQARKNPAAGPQYPKS